jgi:hypothetical protein
LIDESGLLMAPLVRRTRAPRGQAPVLVQKSGTREKVSVAAALGVGPQRDRLGLFSGTLVNGYFDNWNSATFLEALLQELTGRVIVLWDGGTTHKGDPIRALTIHNPLAMILPCGRLPTMLSRPSPTRPVARSTSTWSATASRPCAR